MRGAVEGMFERQVNNDNDDDDEDDEIETVLIG